ncbi:Glutamyl-tRNA(Gln) amidotransferase subunit A [Baekduia alba]|uniref:amidase n=1 Tax=Baekduia alba TaxID=2997333 RepID=UPI0023402DE5|nr:amidase [Baekduia alba]WCB95150.1 Glutamyl-tRNA(Gln) amidotransferase subunit A [Baekduia alba]
MTAVERTRASLERIDALDGALRACVLVRRDAAPAEADAVDRRADPGPLAGLTFAVKDNTDVAGAITTDGLGPPHPAPAAADATAVRRLRAAGAVLVAKANLEQLSFGATTQNPTFGGCRNPWDRTRIPGGSSGGSAVAVAAGLVDVALGTDTGGSLRNPAAFCGVSALRPTHGVVPVAGVTPLSPSMDVVGPIARRVSDLAKVMDVLAPAQAAPGTAADAEGLAVGIPTTYFLDDLDPGVARGFDALLDALRAIGARPVPIALPGVGAVPDAMAALQNAEAARSLRAYWDDTRLSDGIRERMDLGRTRTDEQLAGAEVVADAWRDTVAGAFAQVAVIATPATPFTAPPINADNLVALSRRINRCTGPWPLTRAPALVLPLPLAPDGLPVGGQLVAAPGADARLLALGAALQAHTDWHEQTPPL